MDNVERATTDARFGIIMTSMSDDTVFMWYYAKLEENDPS